MLDRQAARHVTTNVAGVGRNPYPGPRPFRVEEADVFFGRERETLELSSLVLSHRLVLVYAQSGIGKSSLLAAGVAPRLAAQGLTAAILDHLHADPGGPGARFHGAPSALSDLTARLDTDRNSNPYWATIVSGLRGAEAVVSEGGERSGPYEGVALMLDQFEESLVAAHLWKERLELFHLLGQTLKTEPYLRLVLALREDHLAEFLRNVPAIGQPIGAEYELTALDSVRAIEAVTKPAERIFEDCGTSYAEGVAAQLVERVQEVRGPSGRSIQDEHVDLLQLQLVCHGLWETYGCRGSDIERRHVGAISPHTILQDFYASAVRRVAGSRAREDAIRRWFDRELITPAGRRNFVLAEPATRRAGSLRLDIVRRLAEAQVVRSEWRAGSQWYVLPHDRFIEPVRKSNADRLRPWPRSKWIAFGVLIAVTMIGLFLLGVERSTRSITLVVDRLDVTGMLDGPGASERHEFTPNEPSRHLIAAYGEEGLEINVTVPGAEVTEVNGDGPGFLGTVDLEGRSADVVVTAEDGTGTYWLSVAPSGSVLPNDGRAEGELAVGGVDSYGHRAGAGEVVRILASPAADGLDTVLTLFDPKGQEVAFNDDGLPALGSRIDFLTTLAGPYRIEVGSFRASSSGAYRLTVSEAFPIPLDIGVETMIAVGARTTVYAEMTPVAEGVLVFEVTSDAPIDVAVSKQGGGPQDSGFAGTGSEALLTARTTGVGDRLLLTFTSWAAGDAQAAVLVRAVE